MRKQRDELKLGLSEAHCKQTQTHIMCVCVLWEKQFENRRRKQQPYQQHNDSVCVQWTESINGKKKMNTENSIWFSLENENQQISSVNSFNAQFENETKSRNESDCVIYIVDFFMFASRWTLISCWKMQIECLFITNYESEARKFE